MLRTDYLPEHQKLPQIPLPTCRVCKKPVHWLRVQPDMRRAQLKITVGCVHPDISGRVREQTDTMWMDLVDLENAISMAPGEAF